MRYLIVLMVTLQFVSFLYGQDRSNITGHVLDKETKLPIQGATVWLEGSSNRTSTGSKGAFELNVAKGKGRLVFTSLGFDTFYQKIARYAERFVAETNRGAEYLEGDKIQHFWHEHCEFCWEKALTDKNCEFYCTEDMYYWICAECFRDFREKFNWQVKSAEELFR